MTVVALCFLTLTLVLIEMIATAYSVYNSFMPASFSPSPASHQYVCIPGLCLEWVTSLEGEAANDEKTYSDKAQCFPICKLVDLRLFCVVPIAVVPKTVKACHQRAEVNLADP